MSRQRRSSREKKPTPWAWSPRLLNPRMLPLTRGLVSWVGMLHGAPYDFVSRNFFRSYNSAAMAKSKSSRYIGWGAEGDGTGDRYYQAATANGFRATTVPFSIAAIVEMDDYGDYGNLYGIGDDGTAGTLLGTVITTGRPQIYNMTSTPSPANTGLSMPTGEPLLVACTVSGTTAASQRFYVFGLGRKFRRVLYDVAGSEDVTFSNVSSRKLTFLSTESVTYADVYDMMDGRHFGAGYWHRIVAPSEWERLARNPFGLITPYSKSSNVLVARRASAGGPLTASQTDGMKMGDSVTALLTFDTVSLTDGMKMGDTGLTVTWITDNGPDGMKMGDSVTASYKRLVASQTDGMKMGDSPTGTIIQWAVTQTDGMRMGDSVSGIFPGAERVLSDGMKMGDTPTEQVIKWVVLVTDGTKMGDSLTGTLLGGGGTSGGSLLSLNALTAIRRIRL